MTFENSDEKTIKKYLLDPQNVDESMEERLMTDDAFYERFLICEDELIEEYADGNLIGNDALKFERNFLVSDERRKKLAFTRALRSASRPRALTVEKEPNKNSNEKKADGGFFSYFLSPVPVFGGLLIFFSLISFAVWNFYFRNENSDAASQLLSSAFQTERPFNSRISNFDYAPKPDTRGNGPESVNNIELERAANLILKKASEDPTAENLHNLGKLYLARREFDSAITQFEKSESLDPGNAELLNDLGVALLEKAKSQNGSDGSKLELYGRALSRFESALKADPSLTESKFNSALTLQIYLPREAAKAWREYLELDSTSKWAEEARRNLEKLERSGSADLSAAEAKDRFFEAVVAKNDSAALDLLRGNREIVVGKHLAQNLIESFLAAEEPLEREKLLRTIEYAGELEKKSAGDFFLSDAAAHFKVLKTSEQRSSEQDAQNTLNEGFKNCLDSSFSRARENFSAASQKFAATGNEPQKIVADYFTAYAEFNLNGLPAAERYWKTLELTATGKNYKWILANTLYWLGSSQNIIEKFTDAQDDLKRGLKLSESLGDDYLIQRFLSSLAQQNSRIGDREQTLEYLEQLFEHSAAGGSLRQKWRNYSYALGILADLELTDLSEFVALENLMIARETGAILYICDAQNDAAIAYFNKGDFETARGHLSEALRRVDDVKEDYSRKFLTGRAKLIFAELERKAKNFEAAEEHYQSASDIFAEIENNPFRFETAKGKLLTALALGKSAELEREISETIALAEKYRREIADEQKRSGFFNTEQSIYDVAAEFEFSRNDPKAAYEYVETSSSRSLLDWLSRGAEITASQNSEVEILLRENVRPLALNEIRASLPAEVQIIQYAVLDGKLLIFVISRDNFKTFSSNISGEELTGKVKNFLSLLPDENRADELSKASKELYEILIAPVGAERDTSKTLAIIPQKILFHLPFAALESPQGTPLIKDQPIIMSPSANVFLLSSKNAAKKNADRQETLLAVGNPEFNRSKFPKLQDLPAAGRETRELARAYTSNHMFSGTDARKEAIIPLLNNAEIIHFAGHYIVEPRSPLLSSLVLAGDETLSNADLIAQKLDRPKLVVISACDTGIENYYKGEGLVGLSRSFLASGVPVVVGSHWKVDSDASADLMIRFHNLRKTGYLPTAEALRRAQLEMYETSTTMKSPYFWAAFSVIGGYSTY
ncbi:MAG: CHAT domain-containing protein [Pyrinomonadaceae bacterium]|nr:CHAT domain-containing protein [Pyrinomonadaceae bacterium]